MKLLTKPEFLATFFTPMARVALDADPPFDFWIYFDSIPLEDFQRHDCSEGIVRQIWNDATGRFQHVLVDSEHKNIFMVLVLDLHENLVTGHRLLNLNQEYGIEESTQDR